MKTVMKLGDFVLNTQNTPVEKVPKNRLIFIKTSINNGIDLNVHIYLD
jgi:hypothetical protein